MMIKQDYLIRIIQEIFTAIANMLLKRKKITQKEWSEYEDTAQKILGGKHDATANHEGRRYSFFI